ncbi:hypothetical protein Moror_965 [Moniliophthora roreri MCA 2997]|uniref:Uncharacterized protein n=2 Tax=Moniliophthora roreri TaxID=221103 RepID=V2XSV6_MONRO|nr:hypothetical protein Moror_965 [Moniliophthora roreri MCA 2997]KAI3616006.1 hypothetical protein WG66_010277 [Moniliophthora roreri]
MFENLLNPYLSCCSFCKKSPDTELEREDVIDETSRLIPTAEQPPSTPRLVYVDHEQLRERLGTIVRAKEGKMVNVIKRTHFKNRTQTRFDTLGHAAGRMHATVPRMRNHYTTESESEMSAPEETLHRENGLTETQTPTSSLQESFVPHSAKLSLSWED